MYIDGKTRDYKICVCKNKTLCEVADIGNKCGACREMLDELLEKVNELPHN